MANYSPESNLTPAFLITGWGKLYPIYNAKLNGKQAISNSQLSTHFCKLQWYLNNHHQQNQNEIKLTFFDIAITVKHTSWKI